MQHELQHDLSELGLDARNYRALLLMPAIYVAWADRRITENERTSVARIARDQLGFTDAELSPVLRWLTRPPAPLEYRKAFQILLSLAATATEPQVDAAQFPKLLALAERVAMRAAAAFGQPVTLRPAEREALAQLEAVLGVAAGRPWVDVIREVGVDANMLPPPPSREPKKGAPLRRYRTAVRQSQIDTSSPEPDGGIV